LVSQGMRRLNKESISYYVHDYLLRKYVQKVIGLVA